MKSRISKGLVLLSGFLGIVGASCVSKISFFKSPIETVNIGPISRPANLQIPTDEEGKGRRPLVLLLHGFTMDAKSMDWLVHATSAQKKLGFYMIIPNGSRDSKDRTFWNATPWCCDNDKSGIDDEAYLVSLIKEVKNQYPIDPEKIFIVGYSNGGFMANRLACRQTELFAGFVSIAGGMFNDPSQCQPTKAIRMLQVHGTNDSIVHYDGKDQEQPGAEATADFWARNNQCKSMTEHAEKKNISYFSWSLTAGADGSIDFDGSIGDYLTIDFANETDVKEYIDCKQDQAVELWTVNGLNHAPIYKPSFFEELWSFLNHQD